MARKIKYNSKFEERIAEKLVSDKVSFVYEKETFEYFLPVYKAKCAECGSGAIQKRHTYTPDFFLPSGIIVETKGYFKAKDRKILKALKEQRPDLDIRIVFEANGKLRRNTTTTYTDWCDQFGFKWAIKEIPKEWT